MPDLLHISLFDGSDALPPREAAATGQEALDFSLLRVYVRHLAYYTARVADLRPLAGTKAWQGCCPFCDGELRIDALSGWAGCVVCGYQGEVYTLEFMLFGENTPERWETCCRQAEAVMAGTLAEVLNDVKIPVTAR